MSCILLQTQQSAVMLTDRNPNLALGVDEARWKSHNDLSSVLELGVKLHETFRVSF